MNKLIKRIPIVHKFIRKHNPDLKYLIENIGLGLSKSSIILDIGANKGQTIDFFINLNQDIVIHSFEPTKFLVEKLKYKYKTFKNIHIYPIALSNYHGKLKLYTSDYSPTNSLLAPNLAMYNAFGHNFKNILSNEYEYCLVDTLDHWFNNSIKDNEIIDVLKTDTQGNNFNVLKGGLKTLKNNVKCIAVELQYLDFYTNSIPFYEIFRLLYENNFYLFSYYENSKVKGIQLVENNALFLNELFLKKGFILTK